jgi:neutral trehalase
MANRVEQAILRKMYDEKTGLYYSLDARNGKDEQIRINTISSLMPLILDNIGQKQAERLVNDWLLSPNEYWTRYPVPVEPISSKYHNMRVIWRGHQTWVYTNWYIEKGLKKHGYDDIADELTRRTYELIQKEGLREYYSAISGKGERAIDYGWSTLILDMVSDMQNAQT